MSSVTSKASDYVVREGTTEEARLERQYTMMKRVFGRTSPVPPTVDLSRLSTVLDVGAGTCAWTLDLARQPEIQPHLVGTAPAVRLHACDLSLAKFPPRAATDALGIAVFAQDATQAFPAALRGTCDLVHASLLVGALTADGWRAALGSYWDLLKPGGTLILSEVDAMVYTEACPPPAVRSLERDPEECMDGTTWRHKLNTFWATFGLSRGLMPYITLHLASLLEAASFEPPVCRSYISPLGRLCRQYKGADGGSLASEEEFTLGGSEILFGSLVRAAFERGVLEAPRGTRITTEEGRDELLKEIIDGLREEGGCTVWSEFVTRKL